MVAASHLHSLGVVAADFTDPAHERTIYLAAAGLVLLGVVLLVGTVVWWRGTRGEHSALAPLELMGQRSWARAPYADRVRRLESVRVRSDGDPVEPSANQSEEIDLDELLRSFQPGFDDLRDEPVSAPVLIDAVPDSPAVVREADGHLGATPPADADRATSSTSDPADAAVAIAEAGDLIVDVADAEAEADPPDAVEPVVVSDERARGLAVGAAAHISPGVDPLLADGVNET